MVHRNFDSMTSGDLGEIVSFGELSIVRSRLKRGGYSMTDLGLYCGVGLSSVSRELGFLQPLLRSRYDDYCSALDQFDVWVGDGWTIIDKVRVHGERLR